MYQSTIQNIVIKRRLHGIINVCAPMYAGVRCKTIVHNRGIRTEISWPAGGWITVWSSGLRILQLPSKLETIYIFPKDARLYCSETLLVSTSVQKIVLKYDIYLGSESKSPRTSNFPKCLCAPAPVFAYPSNICPKDQDCEVHAGDCSLDDMPRCCDWCGPECERRPLCAHEDSC